MKAREFLKELCHCISDWCVWSAMIPFLTQLRFYIWIIPASISSVQIYFWLVINVTSYLVFSLQTDLIWSSVFYMWSWLVFQKFTLEGCKRNCLTYHLRGQWEEPADSGWNSHFGNYRMWEKIGFWEQWGKFLFCFLPDLSKTVPRTSQRLFLVCKFVKWYH